MLRYDELQVTVGVVFLVLVLLMAAVFVTVGLQTVSDVRFERVQSVGYWLRKRWLGFLCALLVLVVGLSLFQLPYAWGGGGGGRTVVHVTGLQFAWIIAPAELPLNKPIRFEVTSRDVNHGFAVYDPHGHLVGSVQAMPGYHNKLDLTMSDPGRYTFTCLEYCGLRHHVMNRDFDVTP